MLRSVQTHSCRRAALVWTLQQRLGEAFMPYESSVSHGLLAAGDDNAGGAPKRWPLRLLEPHFAFFLETSH
jgi:hypothetical protein